MLHSNMKVLPSNYQVDETIQTIIGLDSHLNGELISEGSLRIEGNFSGKIFSRGVVYVGYQSVVEANITAHRLIVAGKVNGDIEVIDSIEILGTGHLYGDISGKKLVIDEGADFKGKVNMDLVSPLKVAET